MTAPPAQRIGGAAVGRDSRFSNHSSAKSQIRVGQGCRHCCILLALSLPCICGVAAAETDADVYVNRYAEYLRGARNLSFDFEYTTYEVGGGIGPEEKLIGFARGSAAARNDEFRRRRRHRYRIWSAGAFAPHDLDSEEVVTAKRRLHIQAFFPTNGDDFDVMNLPIAGEPPVVVTWEEPPPIEIGNLDVMCNALYGMLPDDGGRYVVDIMRSGGRNEVIDDQVDGVRVKRLTSSSAYGSYSVWLDPAAGDAPRRIEIRKGKADLFSGAPLSSYRLGDPDDRQPHAPMREYRFEVDNVQLMAAPEGDRFAMSKFDIRTIRVYDAGASFTQRNAVTLTNLQFEATDSDFQPAISVPDGTRVYIKDAPSIQAGWRSGEIVKAVNQEALRRFEGVGAGGTSQPFWQRWLFILNVAVVLGVAVYVLWRRRSLRRGPT